MVQTKRDQVVVESLSEDAMEAPYWELDARREEVLQDCLIDVFNELTRMHGKLGLANQHSAGQAETIGRLREQVEELTLQLQGHDNAVDA